jgi:hypothetical protein
MNRSQCATSDLPPSNHPPKPRLFASRSPHLWRKKTVRRRADRRPPRLGPSANRLQIPSPNRAEPSGRSRHASGWFPRQSWLPDRLRAADHRTELVPAPRTHRGVRFFHSVLCSGLLAHGQHRPDLRRPGAGADRQPDKTPRRRSNQGSTAQGAGSSARNRPRRSSLSRAARPLPEFVNPMSELTTNRLWNTGPKDRPSQYARMIPWDSRDIRLPGSRRPPTPHRPLPRHASVEITTRHAPGANPHSTPLAAHLA